MTDRRYVRFSDKLTASLTEINRAIQENKATMDAIQDIALELTRAIGALEATASRYAKMVDPVVESVMPILTTIPLVDKRTVEIATEVREVARKVLQVCTTSEQTIRDVEYALVNADMAKLRAHTGDLRKMTKALQSVLPTSRSG